VPYPFVPEEDAHAGQLPRKYPRRTFQQVKT